MKKADLILKKSKLFEDIAFFGRKEDFIKICSEEINYQDFNEKSDDSLENIEYHTVKNWLDTILPEVVLRYIVEPCAIKRCGTVSQKIVDLAKDYGLNAEVEDLLGHATALIKIDEGIFRVDATHLQSLFPYHGALRDFARWEREEGDDHEYKRMKRFFEELKENPMKAVKIEFYKN